MSRRYNIVYVQSGILGLDQMVNIFIVFYKISWLIMVLFRLYIYQINFSPDCNISYFFNVHFTIILKYIHT